MSRRSSRRGRPYQPLPARGGSGARIVVIVILVALVIGFLILSFSGGATAPPNAA
jgi:hypothetical protein